MFYVSYKNYVNMNGGGVNNRTRDMLIFDKF